MGHSRLLLLLSFAGVLFLSTLPSNAQVTIGAGQTQIFNGDNPFNGGAITFQGGTLQAQGPGIVPFSNNLSNPITLNGIATIDAGGVGGSNPGGQAIYGKILFHGSIFTGVIGGSGASLSLTDSVGGGEIILSNANTFTAPVNVGAVTVGVGNSSAFGSNTIYLNGGSTLQNTAPPSQDMPFLNVANDMVLAGPNIFAYGWGHTTYSGSISGSGSLTITGIWSYPNYPIREDFALTGSNTYSGGTTINDTQVSVGNSAAFGSGTIYLNSSLLQTTSPGLNIANNIVLSVGMDAIYAYGGNATFSGSISGPGSLSIFGGFVPTLTGNNSYTGGTSVSNASIGLGGPSPLGLGAASFYQGIVQIAQNGTTLVNSLRFSQSEVDLMGHTAVFSGPISGDRSLEIDDTVGGGVLKLSGPVSGFGPSSVGVGGNGNAVTLQMGAADALPQMTIFPNAAFDMNGYPQTITSVSNSGIIKTGAATLTAGSFQTSGTLAVVPFAGGPNVRVAGAASLGGTLQIGPAPSRNYTIIQAGTLTGTFDSIVLPSGYSDSNVSYANNELTLDLLAPSFDPPSGTPSLTLNQQAVGGAFSAQDGSNADMNVVLAQFGALTTAQQAQALDAVSPIAYAGLSGVAFAAADVQSESISRRMAALQAAFADSDPFCRQEQPAAEGSPYCKAGDSRWSTYGWGLQRQGRLDGENGAAGFQPGYDFRSWGALAGADYRINDHLAAGLAGGYVRGSANIDNGVGSLASDSLRVGAYAAGLASRWHGDVYMGGAFDSFTANRDIAFGSINRAASASPSGGELNLSADIGRDVEAPLGMLLYPSFLLGYNRLSVGAFSESGAGALDLNVAGQTAESMRHILGAKLSRPFRTGRFLFSPYVSAGWEHEYLSQERSIAAEFSTGQGSFATNTADVSRDGLLAGAGFAMGFTRNVALRAGYLEDVRSDFVARTLDGNLTVKF